MASMNVLSTIVSPGVAGDGKPASGPVEGNPGQAGKSFSAVMADWLAMMGLGGQDSGENVPGTSEQQQAEVKKQSQNTPESLMVAMLTAFGPQLFGMGVAGTNLGSDFPAGKEANSGRVSWEAVPGQSADMTQDVMGQWTLGPGPGSSGSQKVAGGERSGMTALGQGDPALVPELDQDIIQTLLKALSGEIQAKTGFNTQIPAKVNTQGQQALAGVLETLRGIALSDGRLAQEIYSEADDLAGSNGQSEALGGMKQSNVFGNIKTPEHDEGPGLQPSAIGTAQTQMVNSAGVQMPGNGTEPKNPVGPGQSISNPQMEGQTSSAQAILSPMDGSGYGVDDRLNNRLADGLNIGSNNGSNNGLNSGSNSGLHDGFIVEDSTGKQQTDPLQSKVLNVQLDPSTQTTAKVATSHQSVKSIGVNEKTVALMQNTEAKVNQIDAAGVRVERPDTVSQSVSGANEAGADSQGQAYQEAGQDAGTMKKDPTQVDQGQSAGITNAAINGAKVNSFFVSQVSQPQIDTPPIWQQIASAIQGRVALRNEDALKRPEIKELEIQLHPAELGKIQIALRWDQGTVHLQVQASEQGTGTMLQNHLSDLRQSLQNAGVACGMLQMGLNGEGRRRPYPELTQGFVKRQQGDRVSVAGKVQGLELLQGWESPGLNGQRLNVTA